MIAKGIDINGIEKKLNILKNIFNQYTLFEFDSDLRNLIIPVMSILLMCLDIYNFIKLKIIIVFYNSRFQIFK